MKSLVVVRHVPVFASPGVELCNLRWRQCLAAGKRAAQDSPFLKTFTIANDGHIPERMPGARPRDGFDMREHGPTLPAALA